MNIFYLDHDPAVCSFYHVDKHCVKMILEYAQLLSTAHRVIDGQLTVGLSASGRKKKVYAVEDIRNDVLYSATHINHPSAIWTRQSDSNYQWLYSLWRTLMQEYTSRYHKNHASERLIPYLENLPHNIASQEFTQPTPAMPDEYKVPHDSIASYRKYYIGAKKDLAKWKHGQTPEWFLGVGE